MLARQRQGVILEQIRRRGGVRVGDLTRLLGVSDMTVRRDLDVLAAQGLIVKVHGGATATTSRSLDEPGFEAKSVRQLGEKDAIAARAVELVRPGMAIALSAGTTTREVARRLSEVAGSLTVVTNSIRVAEVLHHNGRLDHTVILVGGVRTPSDALVGPVAVDTIRSLHLDLVFIGVHGMHPRAGFTTPNLLEADTNRALIEAAHRVVVVADHTKWGTVGLSRIAPLDEASVLVTDDLLHREAQAELRECVGELVVAATREAVEPLAGGTPMTAQRRREGIS